MRGKITADHDTLILSEINFFPLFGNRQTRNNTRGQSKSAVQALDRDGVARMNDVPVAIDVYAARFEAGGLFFFKLGAGSDKHDELRAEQLTVTIPVAADDAKKQQSKQSRS